MARQRFLVDHGPTNSRTRRSASSGAGNIGKKVARLTQAFHMRVRYYDVDRLGGDAEDALGARFALFPELLKISDIVSLHVPLDTTTPN